MNCKKSCFENGAKMGFLTKEKGAIGLGIISQAEEEGIIKNNFLLKWNFNLLLRRERR